MRVGDRIRVKKSGWARYTAATGQVPPDPKQVRHIAHIPDHPAFSHFVMPLHPMFWFRLDEVSRVKDPV